MNPLRLPASYYQQFDADYTRDVPGEAYGGWKTADVELAPDHTALVVMHAWDGGSAQQWPGLWRSTESMPRTLDILAKVFPPLLAAVRRSPLPVFHVVGGRDYYSHLPGYQQTKQLAEPAPRPTPVAKDPVWERLQQFRREHGIIGSHNWPDVAGRYQVLDFAPEARPLGNEPIAQDGTQLAALCHAHGINHLVYVGFAVNWCMVMSPGGMVDMGRHGVMCSAIREAVTAIENRETARDEREKQQALWRIALQWGFVFGVDDFIRALPLAEKPHGA
jgi:nicotinamidase-related amidase